LKQTRISLIFFLCVCVGCAYFVDKCLAKLNKIVLRWEWKKAKKEKKKTRGTVSRTLWSRINSILIICMCARICNSDDGGGWAKRFTSYLAARSLASPKICKRLRICILSQRKATTRRVVSFDLILKKKKQKWHA
jgi:hypothetical protein